MKTKVEKYGTLILLEGMWEVGQILEKTPSVPWDIQDFRDIVGRNKNLAAMAGKYTNVDSKESFVSNLMEDLNESFEQIEKGDPTKNDEIASLAEKLKDMALEIEPSLKFADMWGAAEQGVAFDAGAIAEDAPNPMFNKVATEDVTLKQGAGDGAYRVVINTDCCYFQDPTRQGAAVIALAMIVQQKAPLEIWVQQGWLGGGAGSKDGITLFPIHSGGLVSPQNIWFWIASPHKDSPFSYTINRVLGRKRSGVSGESELPCDLYLYNVFMPEIYNQGAGKVNEEMLATWVAKTSKKMMFEEQAPQNLGEKTDSEEWFKNIDWNKPPTDEE
jgi:hypothetical protein